VVPTSYTDLGNTTITSNQYSVTENYISLDPKQDPGGQHVQPGRTMPGCWFYYDFSAVRVSACPLASAAGGAADDA
jgi:hypothetical protein